MDDIIHLFEIPDQVYKKLLECINDKSDKWNKELAGNIKDEYSLKKYAPQFESFLLSQIKDSKYLTEYFDELRVVTDPLPLTLENFWVNFQKKHEFNPLHKHSGLLSFVLFIKIPFIFEEEKLICPGKESNSNWPGSLVFVYPDVKKIGGISMLNLDIDKRWEGKGVIFRADLNHFVNPFFSDGTRITISGNISLKSSQIKLNERE